MTCDSLTSATCGSTKHSVAEYEISFLYTPAWQNVTHGGTESVFKEVSVTVSHAEIRLPARSSEEVREEWKGPFMKSSRRQQNDVIPREFICCQLLCIYFFGTTSANHSLCRTNSKKASARNWTLNLFVQAFSSIQGMRSTLPIPDCANISI